MAEKYPKGFLVSRGWNLEKVHDLVKLLNECKKKLPNFDDLNEACILVNDYYIETRYPLDAPVDYSSSASGPFMATTPTKDTPAPQQNRYA